LPYVKAGWVRVALWLLRFYNKELEGKKGCGLYPGKEIAFLKKAYRDDERMQDGGCLTSIAGSSEIIICRYTET